MSEVEYQIQDISRNDEGLTLALVVEGERLGTAHVNAHVLADMDVQLQMSRDNVRAVLQDALVRSLKGQLAKVEVTPPIAMPKDGLRYVSRYVYRDFTTIHAGVVWYDVPSSVTGPDGLAAVVRNKMRFEVHRLLAASSPNTLDILNLSR